MKKSLLLLLLATSLSGRAQGTLTNGLLARFPFDNNLVDATGNINPGLGTNVAYGADARGQASAALRLVGTGDVAVQPNGLFDFSNTGSFSCSAAFRTLSSGTQSFFSNQGAGGSGDFTISKGWSFGFDTQQVGKVFLNLVSTSSSNGGLGIATQASFNDGLWHTAAAVVNRSTRQIQLYVDGVAQPLTYVSSRPNYGTVAGTVFTLDANLTAAVDLSPGYNRNANYQLVTYNRLGFNFNGWLDETRFYNRALTTAEVQALSAQVLATLSAQAAAAQVQVLPNPGSAAALTVQLAQAVDAGQLQVLDLLGRAVPVVLAARPGRASYDLRGLAAGTYLLRVSLPEGVAVRRFQVE